jgi:hypothetical protein
MENNNLSHMDPNFIPEEFRTPYDIVELPSQGLLYKNKKSKVKVEFLTAMDENILSSPNLSNDPDEMISVLFKRKLKEFEMDVDDLLIGDRLALLIFLRVTGLGESYKQIVYDPDSNDFVEGEIDLSTLKQKKLLIKPDENGEFDYLLPQSKRKVKFKFLTAKDDKEIDRIDNEQKKRSAEKISNKVTIRLEKTITEIDGERDKIIISNMIKKLPLIDSRSLRKYIEENEPGIDFNTTARIHGGGSVSTFLRLGKNFLWPEL